VKAAASCCAAQRTPTMKMKEVSFRPEHAACSKLESRREKRREKKTERELRSKLALGINQSSTPPGRALPVAKILHCSDYTSCKTDKKIKRKRYHARDHETPVSVRRLMYISPCRPGVLGSGCTGNHRITAANFGLRRRTSAWGGA
jgi:hypothetical protein